MIKKNYIKVKNYYIKIKYDKKGRLIYYEYPSYNQSQIKYDDKNNIVLTYFKDDRGFESWYKDYVDNNLLYFKNNKGTESYYDYNNNKSIKITKKEFEEIKFRAEEKEYLSRTKCSRFELIDI